MARMNGCNADLPTGPIGDKSTRMNPAKATRQNMSRGGVNDHSGGSDKWDGKPALSKGDNGTGKYHHNVK